MTNSTVVPTTQQSMFGYDASMPMAWIGGIIFTLMFVVHAFQYFHYHGFYLYLFMLGIAMELCGYWTRVVAIKQPDNNAAAAMTYLLITIAPSFFAATCYMTFGRIVYWVTPEDKRTIRYTWAPVRWITTFFVSWDMAGFVISCIGVFVLIANATKKDLTPDQQVNNLNITYSILRVAFIWQIIVFAIFSILSFRFMFASKAWKYDWPQGDAKNWRKIAWTVNGASSLITCRSLYRCLAFTLNRGDNYLRDHEWTFYMFDFLPIMFLLILFSLVHPANYLPRDYTTVRHAYKRDGFRPVAHTKEIVEDDASSGYSQATLRPPHLAPSVNQIPEQQQEVPQSAVSFTDPWNNRSSLNHERY